MCSGFSARGCSAEEWCWKCKSLGNTCLTLLEIQHLCELAEGITLREEGITFSGRIWAKHSILLLWISPCTKVMLHNTRGVKMGCRTWRVRNPQILQSLPGHHALALTSFVVIVPLLSPINPSTSPVLMPPLNTTPQVLLVNIQNNFSCLSKVSDLSAALPRQQGCAAILQNNRGLGAAGSLSKSTTGFQWQIQAPVTFSKMVFLHLLFFWLFLQQNK